MYEYDKEAAEREFEWVRTLENSIYWLKAVAFQGQRLIIAMKEPYKHTNSSRQNTKRTMEEYYFLGACRKAHRWLDLLNLTTPEAHRFMSLESKAKNVRDNREHDEERYGIGSKRKESMHKIEGTNITASTGGTVITNGRILIGAAVDLAEVIVAAEALLPSLIAEFNAYWDKRNDGRPDIAESYHIEPRFSP